LNSIFRNPARLPPGHADRSPASGLLHEVVPPNRPIMLATVLLIASSTAADADWLAYLFGPGAFLAARRTATDSILGILALAALVAGAFCWFARKRGSLRVRFGVAFALAAAGAALRVVLDLADSCGAKPFWPFGPRIAGDLVASVDPWVLALLLAGLLLPSLFAVVRGEIGARSKTPVGRWGAIVVLTILALYLGARGVLHSQAVAMLEARTYAGQLPRRVGAFPDALSPFTWRGLVETQSAIHEVHVPLGPGAHFDSERGKMLFKPEPSPALEAAQRTRVANEFLAYARFPVATVETSEVGLTITLRDLRFTALGENNLGVMAVVRLDEQDRLVYEGFRFDSR
jgi:membrane-bound metal-dependent hydrolase YbcI (DUF457 family)